jgi:hypothetical protein
VLTIKGVNMIELPLRIVLDKPPADVAFGLQSGKGRAYRTVQTQSSKGEDLSFDFSIQVKEGTDEPKFAGPFVQGSSTGRFIYFDIGQFAGQKDSCWNRRLKIPLTGIS